MRRLQILLFAILAAAALPAAAQVNVARWGAARGLEKNAIQATQPALGPGADLHLEFPIYNRALPNRAQLHATLVYDSLLWGAPNGTWQPSAGAGWWLRTSAGRLLSSQDYGTCGHRYMYGPGDDGSGSYTTTTYSFHEPDGTLVSGVGSYTVSDPPHSPPPPDYEIQTDWPASSYLPQTWQIYDGKGFKVTVDQYGDASAWDGYGDDVTDGLTDPNGNSMSAGGTDALGAAVAIAGSGTPSSPVTYTYTGPNGAHETTTVLYESAYISANFGCYTSWSGNVDVPEAIEYPDGSTYTFSYSSNGFLASVTDPSGGTTYYSGWYMGVQCSPFYITDGYDEYNSIDGSSHMWSWTYDSSSAHMTQTDPYGAETVLTYDGSGDVAERDVYAGAWNNSFRISKTTYTGGAYGRTVVTSLCSPSDPSDPCGSSDTGQLESSSTTDLDYYGMVTSTSTTDWGTGSPPATPLRQALYTYTVVGDGEVPASMKVEDGSGNVAAETAWSYNGSVNPVSESRYTSASAALTSTYAWNSNGTLHSVTAPNGGVTTFGYTCGTGFFPNSVQSPVGTTTAQWDCNGAVETSAVDLNGNTSSASYDALWRPITTTNAEGTTTSYSYPSSSNAYTQSERVTTSGNSTADVLTVLDALGRPVLSQRRQAPGSSSFDSVETVYDLDSRPYEVSMPYVGSAGAYAPSGTAMTVTTYDALARPVTVVDGGGGEADYAYNQNDVLSTVDAAGSAPAVSRQEQFDALGRLASVCELTAGTGIGGNWPAGACGQTHNAGNGYLTTYARNPLGQITSVTQNAQSANHESRTYAFDELGRLTEEINPETKNLSVSYTYDSDSACGASQADAGALVARVNARGITTCYLHAADDSGRLAEVTYSDGTPAKYFVYATANPQTVEGFSVTDAVGRLAEAYTGSHATDDVFSYDKMGRPILAAQKTPDSGGWVQSLASYAFNGATTYLSLFNNGGGSLLPAGVTYGLDGEGRPDSATASSSALVTAATYSPLGLASITYASGDSHTDTDNYSYSASTGRMSGYSFTVDGATDAGAYTWLANGELSGFSISDGVSGTADNGFACTYSHDDMGRLSAANCGASSNQTYTFDPFGNVCKTAVAGTNFCPSYNLYNQVASVSYDSDGDPLSDPVSGFTNVYNAEGRATTFDNVAVTYDALNRAVEAGGQEFIYGPSGTKIAVMNGQTLVRADIPLVGGAEAIYNSSGFVAYRHTDLLGSSRLATNYNGGLYSETALAPYGEPLLETGTHDRSFTGAKQDIANGTAPSSDANGDDDFLAREYSPTQSRWWTPDPAALAAVDPNNPQTWDEYSYANNTSLSLIDPLGLAVCRPTAKLHLQNRNQDDEASGEFGPYEPQGDSAAGEQAADPPGYSGCANDPPCTNFTIDGGDAGCSGLGGAELGSGGGVACPDNFCEGGAWATDPNGKTVGGYFEYMATAGWVDGYYEPSELASGIHDIGGKLYSDAGYKQESIYLAYQVCMSLSAGVSAKGTANCTDPEYLNGAHFNYEFTCNPGASCAGRYANGVHIENIGTAVQPSYVIHFDSVSPYIGPKFTWGGLNWYDLALHGLDDYVYGHICNCILPH